MASKFPKVFGFFIPLILVVTVGAWGTIVSRTQQRLIDCLTIDNVDIRVNLVNRGDRIKALEKSIESKAQWSSIYEVYQNLEPPCKYRAIEKKIN